MKFPQWVDDPKHDNLQRTQARLSYLIGDAAARMCQNGSVRKLAERAGVDRTTIYYAIRAGEVGESLAAKLQEGAGYDADNTPILPAQYLRAPLEIPAE